MRRKILAANWKMYKTSEETAAFLQEFKNIFSNKNNIEIVIAPPFTSLETAHKEIKGSSFKLSAQNMHGEDKGAFTGEISALMLKALGCEYVILGHSERRHIFLETDAQINKKNISALRHGLKVIFCIGEKNEERDSGQTNSVLEKQISLGLQGVSKNDLSKVVIAYEPVWAIGTGKVATPEQAEEAHRFIRKIFWDTFGMDSASQMSILYGGSVKPDNIKELSSQPNVDGALVGGASLDPKSFIEILKGMA